jgi:hypothetical protein
MRITRHADAVPYVAPAHTNVDTRRLQGLEAGETENFWVGLSVYPPGGIAESSPTRAETIYFVIASTCSKSLTQCILVLAKPANW